MADQNPTQWSLSNQVISNYGTIADKRLTTITPENPTGFIPLDPNSNDPIVKNLQYAIQVDGKVTYRNIPSEGPPRLYNNIQEIAGQGVMPGISGYTDQTTLKIKNSLTEKLRTDTDKKIVKGQETSPYAQTNPNKPDQEGSSPEDVNKGLESFNSNLDKLQKEISDGGLRQKYTGGKGPGGAYMYPINMDKTQDKIKITMYRYAPKKIDVSNIAVGAGFSGGNVSTNNKGQKIVMGTAILPIQPQISDSNGVVWGEDSLNSIEAMAGAAALGTILGGGNELANAVEGSVSLIKGKAKGDIKAGMAAFLAGKAIGANQSFFTRATGGILNPNLELLFQGPTLRSFTFNFVMSAREKAEAEEIRNIIRFFKQGMSVKRSSSNLFLKTPNVFDISYIYGGDGNEHPWINKIKTCALQNCVVNYTPDGNYATFKDGPMTQYQMSLTFGEIDPIYDDDYGTDDSTTNIGY
jgi:hypothetical protein